MSLNYQKRLLKKCRTSWDNMRIDENKFYLNRIYNEFLLLFPEGATIGEFAEAVLDGSLQLELSDKEVSQVIDENCLEEIKNTIPSIQRIIHKPRAIIISHEEKVPIETAKRINCKAISLLARDSNDWHTRTFLSVKPKNIVSDINEETIETYENRLVKSLIDKMLFCVVRRRQYLENLLNIVETELATSAIENTRKYNYNYFKNNKANGLLKTICGSNGNSSEATCHELRGKLEDTLSIENKVRMLKKSNFYSLLRKTRPVSNPIQKTNIIMFEQNYKKAYLLWMFLNSQIMDEEFSIDEVEENIEGIYTIYCFENLVLSLVDLGYSEVNGAAFFIKDKMLAINKSMCFEKDNNKIQIDVENGLFIVSILKDEERNLWDKICIYSNYGYDFENKTRNEIENQTDEILNKLRKKSKSIDGKFAFVSMDIHHCSDKNDFGEKIYRRLYSIGDNYSDEEKNIDEISGYKTGIQIISPLDLRENFTRIERLINSRVLRIHMLDDIDKCPLCGSEHINQYGNNDYVCHDCNHRISISLCNHCKKDMLWIKYNDDSALKQESVTRNIDTQPYYFQLKRYEAIMGMYAISAFTMEHEVSGWKVKSLCPHCGKKLGEKD